MWKNTKLGYRIARTGVGTTGDTGDMSPMEIEAQGTRNVFVPCSPLYIGHIFALILHEYGKNVAIRAQQLAKL